tara:strand:- start:251 stop:931 length:681 start_codon:yes stop_codon:yes gene_type:complete
MNLRQKRPHNITAPANIKKYNELNNESRAKDPIRLWDELLELNRLESIDVIPKAGKEIYAFIIHTREVTVGNTGIANKDLMSIDPAMGYFGKEDPNHVTKKWLKAYGYVDFYSSCLPFPENNLIGKQEIVAEHKGTKGGAWYPELLLDAWDISRISRFPYFLVPVDNSSGKSQDLPSPGRMAVVKFIDNDNFSYGVFLRNAPINDTTQQKPPVVKYTQPVPLVTNP